MLYQNIELHSDICAEEAQETMRNALTRAGSGFHGKEEKSGNGEFIADYKEKGSNAFRPEICVRISAEDDGCLIGTELRLPKAMLIFMLIWTVIPVIFAVGGHNWLALVVIPVFWVIAVIAFRKGAKSAKDALMTLFEAYEITG